MTNAQAHAYDHRLAQLFWFAMSAVVLFSGLYLYFVNATVWNIVSRQASEKSMKALARELGTLESRYVVLQAAVTEERAEEFGLVSAKSVTFVDSRTTAGALSLRDGI